MNKINKLYKKYKQTHLLEAHHRSITDVSHNEDNGIVENVFSFFLSVVQVFFIGNWLRFFFPYHIRVYITEVYVVIKPLFLYSILYFGLYETVCLGDTSLFVYIAGYFIFETILYNLSTVFASENFLKPNSYKRKIILLFINYIEIVLAFAIIYFAGHHLNANCITYSDSIYFSFVTSATIGYGDIFPISPFGKNLVALQSIIFLIFIVILLGFFASKIDTRDNYIPSSKKNEPQI